MMNQSNLEGLLRSAPEECDRLRAENAHLRMMLGIPSWTSAEPSQTTIPIEVGSESSNAGPPAPEKKIALFRSLFRWNCCAIATGRNGSARTKTSYSCLPRRSLLPGPALQLSNKEPAAASSSRADSRETKEKPERRGHSRKPLPGVD